MDALERVFIPLDEIVDPDVNPVIVALAKRAGLPVDVAITAVRIAMNKRYATEAEMESEVLVVGPLAGWRVRRVKGGGKVYELRWPSGFRAVWRAPEKFLSLPLEERVNVLGDVIVVRAVERGGRFEVEELRSLRTRSDPDALAALAQTDEARHLRDAGLAPEAAAAALLLAEPRSLDAAASLALRLALLSVRGLVHVAEWSRKAVLKSTTFRLAEAYLRWWHLTGERPSLATLIGDARTGVSRLAGVDGVAFDEIGSWRKSSRADDEGFWSAIRSGLTNGIWKRARGGEKSIEIQRMLPTYWAGNPTEAPLGETPPREHTRLWLRRQGLDAEELDAMLSRYAVFWGVTDQSVSDELLATLRMNVYPAPGVVRAYAEYVRAAQRRPLPVPQRCELHDRELVAYRNVSGVFRAVFADEKAAAMLACAAVRGVLTLPPSPATAELLERLGGGDGDAGGA